MKTVFGLLHRYPGGTVSPGSDARIVAQGIPEVQFRHTYCVSQSPDRKSLSFKRCEPVAPAIRLVKPFDSATPKKTRAK